MAKGQRGSRWLVGFGCLSFDGFVVVFDGLVVVFDGFVVVLDGFVVVV